MQQLNSCSRRGFVQVAGIAGIGAALADAGLANAQEVAAEEQADLEPESLEADVCVIGAGPTGLTAAAAAADEGARVLVIEKRPFLGTTGHSITAVGTKWQQELGIDMTPEDLVDFLTTYPDPHQDRDMLLFLARESCATIDWLGAHGAEFVGVCAPPTNPFQEPMRTLVTVGDRDGAKAYLEPLMAYIQEKGVEVRFEVEALALKQDANGAVVGVAAKGSDGHEVEIAARSVVIAAGGYGSNYDLLRRYSPFNQLSQQFQGPQTGFAVTAGLKVGAQLVMPGGCTRSYGPDWTLPADNEGRAIMVTPEGKRFVNENLYFSDCGYLGGEQGISMCYRLYDQDLVAALEAEGVSFAGVDAALAAGTAYKADSLEQLAAQLGMNAAALVETVQRYNAACASGVDEEFGKPAKRTGKIYDPARELSYMPVMIDKEYTLLNPVATPPFYALVCECKAGGAYTITHGGVKTNTDGQVLDCLDQPISGLYAAGESANGQFLGKWYPQSGTSLCICFTMGRFAGASAGRNAL